MHRRSALIGGILSFGLLLAACSDGGGGRKVEDTLTVLCTPQEDWCRAMAAAFEEKTGVKTNYVRLSAGEALARLKADREAPEFSVWWGGSADGFVAAAADGLIEPYVSPNAGQISAQQKDGDGAWTGVYVGALGFCSNVTVLNELGLDVPTSWDDLLDPALKGHVGMAHPASSGTAYTALYTQVVRLGGEDKAMAYMQDLNQNILRYTSSGAEPAEMAGRGEIAVAVVFSHDCVRNIDAGFTDLRTSFPREGTGYEIGGVALVANAPQPNAAKAWIDWSLTAEAQEIGATTQAFQLPTNPAAKVSERSVNLGEVNLVEYGFQSAGKAREALTARFEDEVAPKPAG